MRGQFLSGALIPSRVGSKRLRRCCNLLPGILWRHGSAVKDFFDRTYEELKDDATVYRKLFRIVVSAGNDGSFALSHIERICRGYQQRRKRTGARPSAGLPSLPPQYDSGRLVAEVVVPESVVTKPRRKYPISPDSR